MEESKSAVICIQNLVERLEGQLVHKRALQFVKMPDWYWEKKELHNTPSMEKGLDFDSETKLRQEGVRYLTKHE